MMKKGGSIWDATKHRPGELDKKELAGVYSKTGKLYTKIKDEVGKVIIGQDQVLEHAMVAILTDSHALLEGLPGLGKTLLIKTLSRIMDLSFKRIQCTPDLMPSDITGTYLIVEDEEGNKSFSFEKGPVFANIVLADEINRATPKAQSALLEAMQERQVTAGTETYKLDRPFFVLATQNPIEMEGTYPLPEAQLDRFLLKILVDYPGRDEESMIIEQYSKLTTQDVAQILEKKQLLGMQQLTYQMPISRELKQRVLDIVTNTRPKNNEVAKKYLEYGASPRASIGLVLAAKARALIQGRNYVNKDDVNAMAYPILRHRLILNFESERKGITTDDVIGEVLGEV